MGFESKLYPGEKVVSRPSELQAHAGHPGGRGLTKAMGYANSPMLSLFPSILKKNPSDFQALIQEQEERESQLSKMILLNNVPDKNQENTSQCWINSVTHTIEINRMQQGEEYVSLSPSSVGGPLKNWQDPGGYGEEGLLGVMRMGLCPSKFWPDNAIDPRYYTEANRTLAMNYRNVSGYHFPSNDITEIFSCSYRGVAIAGGYDNISHEIVIVEPVWHNGILGWRIRNPWGDDYGYKGFAIFTGEMVQPDDSCAPTVSLAA